MFTTKIKSVHDLGQTLFAEESDTKEDAIDVAKAMIVEADPTVESFEIEGTLVRGFDGDETESMYYATFEETEELSMDELSEWFSEEFDDDLDLYGEASEFYSYE